MGIGVHEVSNDGIHLFCNLHLESKGDKRYCSRVHKDRGWSVRGLREEDDRYVTRIQKKDGSHVRRTYREDSVQVQTVSKEDGL